MGLRWGRARRAATARRRSPARRRGRRDAGRLMIDSEQTFQEARGVWRAALRDHVLAPPDAGFSARIANLAAAATQRAEACEAASADGFEWPPAKGGAKPPFELQPGSGRRGPAALWARSMKRSWSLTESARAAASEPWDAPMRSSARSHRSSPRSLSGRIGRAGCYRRPRGPDAGRRETRCRLWPRLAGNAGSWRLPRIWRRLSGKGVLSGRFNLRESGDASELHCV